MDLISVIVPVYNVEEYLDRCVESIVNQTYANLEIILVDDGSPDNCPAMCDMWAQKDHRIKVIHKANGGLSDARNTGMAEAAGEYVGFVDSDDWIDPDFYETLLNALHTHNAQLSASNIVFEFEDHSEESKRYDQIIFTPEQSLETISHGNGFHATAWNKLYTTEIALRFPYPVGRLHEDEFVTYRVLAEANRAVLCQQTAYHYRQRQGSIMRSFNEKHLDMLDAYLERLRFFKERYPDLYRKDKPAFCIMLAGFYKSTFSESCLASRQRIQQRLRSYRKMVRYSIDDLRSYSLKQKIYVMGTGIQLGFFSRILYLKGLNE